MQNLSSQLEQPNIININNPLNNQVSNIVSQQQKTITAPVQNATSSQIQTDVVFECQIKKALSFKNEGNKQFKAKQFEQAKQYYQQALQFLDPNTFYGASEAECLKMAELSSNLLFNVGSCFLSQKRWKQAQLLYNQAIVVNPKYIKALYKRALARFELEKFQTAMTDIKQAFGLDKTNKQIYEAYEKILLKYNEEVKKNRQKSKLMNQKIFNSSQRKIKEKEEQIQQEQEPPKNSSWWLLAALAPLAAIGIYQGVKLFRS